MRNPTKNINWHIINPTTPAQYFHALRRQQKRSFRKPLIVVAPKVLLKLNAAVSTMNEMAPGTTFQPVLGDASATAEGVKRVMLLSGKLYYDLVKERATRGLDGQVALIRLEELSPFPIVDVVAAGLDDPTELALWNADQVHHNTAGAALYAQTLHDVVAAIA